MKSRFNSRDSSGFSRACNNMSRTFTGFGSWASSVRFSSAVCGSRYMEFSSLSYAVSDGELLKQDEENVRFSLNQLCSPQIVEMDDSLHFTILVDHHQRRDLLLLHHIQGCGSKFVRSDRFRRPCHALRGLQVHYFFATLLEQTTQIAIANNTCEFLACHDGGHPKLLARHLVDHLLHAGVGRNSGNRVSCMHEGADLGKLLAQFAARMQIREIFFLKALLLCQCNSQRVAKREHSCGRRGWSKSERTGLFVD